MAALTLTQSNKGKPMISSDGYLFRFQTFGLEKRIWECQQRKTGKCPVRIHTTGSLNNPVLLCHMGQHNHNPDAISCEIKETMTNIRQEAITTSHSPAHIIARNVQQTSAATQGALPRVPTIKRGIRNIRKGHGGSLVIRHRREDIDLPETFQKTKTGKDFLLFDSGASSDRILVFSTHKNLEFLAATDLWLVDGTFKVAPTLFDQLFVIHACRNNVTFPLVYCLCPNRTTETYSRILSALKNLNPALAPKTIMSDYEMASINAFNSEFNLGDGDQKGCFFHFSQCVFRHIQKEKEVLHLYSTDADFSLQLGHLVALAFVPIEDVVVVFDHLMTQPFFVQHEELLVDFLIYFERTWLGLMNHSKTARLRPTFKIAMWNCFDAVLERQPKTNNSCEGFHHAFAAMLGATHPTIYKLIEGLQEQQTLTELGLNQYRAGIIAPPNKKYQFQANELRKVVEEYGQPDLSHIDFSSIFIDLRRIAYRIRC